MLQKSIYRDVLKKAWNIAKQNKILWFFGLFAALLGNGGEYQVLIKAADHIRNGADGLGNLKAGLNFSVIFNNVYDFLAVNPFEFALVLTAVFAILFLIGFLIWMVTVSQGALIDGINITAGKKKLDFNETLVTGMKNFAPILGVNVLSKVFISIILFAAGAPLLFWAIKSNGAISTIFYLICFIILVAVSIIISFIAKYAAAFVVLKDKNFFSSIKNAFELFFDNWLVSLEMAFILFLFNLVVGLIAIFLIALVYMPLAAVSYMYFLSGFLAGAWLTAFAGVMLTIIIIGLAGALLSAFQWASWIILFKKLTSRETVVSKIERTVFAFPQWVREHI